MKRLHVHLGVNDLDRSIGFYSALFAAEPTLRKPDYAKWLLDDPRVNFVISQGHGDAGIHHLGIQAEDAEELAEIYGRLKTADAPVLEEGATICCYARSEKSWITDPQGLAWETFFTYGESTVYGGKGPVIGSNPGVAPAAADDAPGCCGPAAVAAAKAGTSSCCGAAAAKPSACC